MSIITIDKPLSEHPFASVTIICSQNKISAAKIRQLLINNPKYDSILNERQLALVTSRILHLQAPEYFLMTRELNEIDRLLDSNGITMPELIDITMQVVKLYFCI